MLALRSNIYYNILLLFSSRFIALAFLFVNYHLHRPLVAFLSFNHQVFFYVVHFHLSCHSFRKLGPYIWIVCIRIPQLCQISLHMHFFYGSLILQCIISLRIFQNAVNWYERHNLMRKDVVSLHLCMLLIKDKFNTMTLQKTILFFWSRWKGRPRVVNGESES